VPGTVLASVPMNVEGGSYLTFAFPIILFCVIGSVLWVQLFRTHRRVPPRRALAGASASPARGVTAAASQGPGSQVTSATTAGSVSGVVPGATGGAAAAESAPAEPGTQPEQNSTADGTEGSE
jgi:hypothetical protein